MAITGRDIASAAIRIRRALTFEERQTATHRVVVVSGLEQAGIVDDLGVYLVGAGFTRAVRTSLRIANESST
jgi:hypothetical protein